MRSERTRQSRRGERDNCPRDFDVFQVPFGEVSTTFERVVALIVTAEGETALCHCRDSKRFLLKYLQ